jgi:hypothetical protein
MLTAGDVGKGALLAALLLVTAWIAAAESLFVLVFPAVALMCVLAAIWRRRPERAMLALAVVLVLGGMTNAGAGVASGIAEERVEYHGRLDANEILTSFHPSGRYGLDDPAPRLERSGYAHLVEAEGDMMVPRANGLKLVAWSLGRVAPWILAAVVLCLIFPIVRAAERGDPFTARAARRLEAVGLLLLVAIPLGPVFDYVVGEFAAPGLSVAPGVSATPAFELWAFLPGAAVLVLAGVFRRGVELRELERRTV